jgi:folate-binding protein YgfZ
MTRWKMTLFHYYTHHAIRIAGPDAQKLLNDTLTCRIDESLGGIGRWFALLSPQGKVQVEGLVTFADSAFWFDIEAGHVAAFVKRMNLYRLRAKVEVDTERRAVYWSPDNQPPPAGTTSFAYRDERHTALGTRYLVDGPGPTATSPEEPVGEYDAVRLSTGVSEWPDFLPNEVFPHDIGMDLLQGVDFVKGCYVGQEVVSRMQHRGTARRRPVIVSGIRNAALGAPVLVGEREAGTLGVVVDGNSVAILRLDRIPGADAATVGGLPVKLSLPQWATYRFGESGSAE